MIFFRNTVKSFVISLLFIILAALLEAKPAELTPSSTHKKAIEILKAHVSYKEFTTEVAKHTVQNFIDELDPIKTYLIEPEILKWIEPSTDLANQLVSGFKKGNFQIFQEIYEVMIQAIERRKRVRG